MQFNYEVFTKNKCILFVLASNLILQINAQDCSISKNTWLPRAFSSYSMHDLVQEKFLFQDEDQNKNQHCLISFFTEYMQNFGSCKNLGSLPFWSETNVMTVGNNTGAADFDAYQLGMGNVITDSDGIAGSIQLNPKMQQIGTDMLIYFLQNKEESGLFFKMHFPLGAMIMYPNLTQIGSIVSNDEISFTQTTANPGSSMITYQFPQYPAPLRRPATILDAFFGGSFSGNDQLDGNRSNPIRLRKGRIAPTKQTVIVLSDLSVSFGYNFVIPDHGNFGIAGKITCPTGNVPTANYILEPIFGRAGAWGAGAEFVGFYNLWKSNSLKNSIDFWWQGEVLHLIPGRNPNYRSFDLKQNGPGSKYLLIQSYSADSSNNLMPYAIEPAVNITTLPVISNIAVEGSIAGMLNVDYYDWNFAIGIEFWGRSAEHLSIDFVSAVDLRLQNLNDYAVLGRQVSGYDIDGQASELSTYYCEPFATISLSKNPVTLVGSVPTVTAPTTLPEGIKDARLSANRIPAKLSDALDIAGAEALMALSVKIFGQFGYTWQQHYYTPSVSVVGGFEWNNN